MKHLLTLLFLILSAQLFAQIHLPSFFSDNMVLQRNTEVNFWGWGNRASNVLIIPSWSKDTVRANTGGMAKFEAKLKTGDAGGPFTITVIIGRHKKVINNILLGEVWFCSGQSNMQWSSKNNLEEMIQELPNAANPKVRLLQITNIGAKTPQDNVFDSWKECDTESATGFSAIGYFIGKQLSKDLDVPIGIINSSWGGTSAEVWTPLGIIESDEELLKNAKVIPASKNRPHESGMLWNSMVYPLAGYTIAGAFWYQGESNVVTHTGYDKLMSNMINSWRNAWGYDFPFYYVQIAPYSNKSKPGGIEGAMLREQQIKTLRLPKTAMAVITDLVPDIANIHPTKKKDVAARLSEIALVEVYGKKAVDYKSPVYKNHKIIGDKVIIEFDYLVGNLQVKGKNITDLFIADNSKNFVPAEFKIEKNKLVVFSKSIKKPVAVRFGFTDASMPNLFNRNGLPVSPFRTDSW